MASRPPGPCQPGVGDRRPGRAWCGEPGAEQGDDEDLLRFLYQDQPIQQAHDNRAKVNQLMSAGGPEVRPAGEPGTERHRQGRGLLPRGRLGGRPVADQEVSTVTALTEQAVAAGQRAREQTRIAKEAAANAVEAARLAKIGGDGRTEAQASRRRGGQGGQRGGTGRRMPRTAARGDGADGDRRGQRREPAKLDRPPPPGRPPTQPPWPARRRASPARRRLGRPEMPVMPRRRTTPRRRPATRRSPPGSPGCRQSGGGLGQRGRRAALAAGGAAKDAADTATAAADADVGGQGRCQGGRGQSRRQSGHALRRRGDARRANATVAIAARPPARPRRRPAQPTGRLCTPSPRRRPPRRRRGMPARRAGRGHRRRGRGRGRPGGHRGRGGRRPGPQGGDHRDQGRRRASDPARAREHGQGDRGQPAFDEVRANEDWVASEEAKLQADSEALRGRGPPARCGRGAEGGQRPDRRCPPADPGRPLDGVRPPKEFALIGNDGTRSSRSSTRRRSWTGAATRTARAWRRSPMTPTSWPNARRRSRRSTATGTRCA